MLQFGRTQLPKKPYSCKSCRVFSLSSFGDTMKLKKGNTMDKEYLLRMCNLLDYGITINDNNAHWYDDAIEKGYVEVRKPKRATKFFLTEEGVKAIQPVLYLHIFRKFYFTRDTQITEDEYERYHEAHKELGAWDLLIQYHKDKVNEYDGNRTQRPPRTYIYFIANLYKYSGRKLEAGRYYMLIYILDMSGVMEVPTFNNLDIISPPTKERILKKSGPLPAIMAEIVECLEERKALEVFQEMYSAVNLPISVRTKEEMEQVITDLYKVNRG